MFRSLLVAWIFAIELCGGVTEAFVSPLTAVGSAHNKAVLHAKRQLHSFSPQLNAKAKKGPEEDLSYIETRQMTREEMLELNKKNEEVMNAELGLMTGFSLLISLPILYLCWVAFFSD
jgi:hypothetical protein